MRTVKFPRFFTVCFALVFTLYAHSAHCAQYLHYTRTYSYILAHTILDWTIQYNLEGWRRYIYWNLHEVLSWLFINSVYVQYSRTVYITIFLCGYCTSLINPLLCWYTFFTWVPNFFVSCSTSCDKIVGFCILAQIILLLFSKMQWKYDIS